jgi:NhaP-type Na+/H+ or K+/H+ antiporter
MGFVLEALVFILIGFSLRGVVDRIGDSGGLDATMALGVLGVLLTVAVSRFVWIFAADIVLAILRRLGWGAARPLGWRQATVLSWAGMRGVVTLAVALSVPVEMSRRDLILVSAFAVIFATVILQGSSLGRLIRRTAADGLTPGRTSTRHHLRPTVSRSTATAARLRAGCAARGAGTAAPDTPATPPRSARGCRRRRRRWRRRRQRSGGRSCRRG